MDLLSFSFYDNDLCRLIELKEILTPVVNIKRQQPINQIHVQNVWIKPFSIYLCFFWNHLVHFYISYFLSISFYKIKSNGNYMR